MVPSGRIEEEPRRHRIRAHNEQLATSARSHRFEDDVAVPFLCECDDEDCQEYVPLTLPEYAEWSEAHTFTAPQHEVAGGVLISQTHTYTLHMTGPHRPGD